MITEFISYFFSYYQEDTFFLFPFSPLSPPFSPPFFLSALSDPGLIFKVVNT